MDDPPLVGVCQALSAKQSNLDSFLRRWRPLVGQVLGQGAPLDLLHHHERTAIVLTDVVNDDDGWVGECRDRQGLPREAV